MIDKQKVLDVIENHLSDFPSIFLVELRISTDNRISVSIDGDDGITIDECIALSRAIEGSLDREEQDFELNVASSGVDTPLKFHRQYVKNVGRAIKVETKEGDIWQGVLTTIEPESITITPKQITKGKKIKTQIAPLVIPFNEIKEAKIIIMF